MMNDRLRQASDHVECNLPCSAGIGYSRGMNDAPPSPGAATTPQNKEVSLTLLVGALLTGHIMASMALLVLPALAPEVAREHAIDPSLIGYYISLVCVGQLVTLMWFGNITRRYGGSRINQLGHSCVAVGIALAMLPAPVFLGVGAVVVGFGYGFIGPSFSHLLMRFAPPHRRNFIFSLQQTGVPMGGIAAALLCPAIALAFGWRWAILLCVLLLGFVLLLMQYGRAGWDDDRDRTAHVLAQNPLDNVMMVWRTPALRRIALAGGAFCWAQFCVSAYTVVACVKVFDMSLIAAGGMLTIVQIASALGRMIVGWSSDRLRNTSRVLAWNAMLMIAICITSIWMSPEWPLAAIYVLFALHGLTSGAWAGAVLAETGRVAPRGAITAAMSGAFVYLNVGKMIGPIVFANVYLITQSYGWAFASLAIPALCALIWLQPVKK